jgi:hypothetical protein
MINFIYTWIGLSNASGSQYLFWSGFFGDVTIFAGIVIFYWKHTCHQNKCYRIGKHTPNGTPYCTKHHPNLHNRDKIETSTYER